MDLSEAIKHCEEVAEENIKQAKHCSIFGDKQVGLECVECAVEHRQLAEWLRELKAYRKLRRILSQNRIATDRYGDVVMWSDIKRILDEVKADDY